MKLSLSTSTPTQYGAAPLLKSWFLSYINPINVMDRNLSKSNSLETALEGRASGVAVGAGNVGATTKVTLRGSNSISADNNPLYVVNGVPMGAADFAKLNPNSIKEMNVLKDASATSLYGARATNGAIVVTLKEGLEDYVSVAENELDVSYDIDLPYDVPTNGKQQIATLKEASVNGLFKYYAVPKLDFYLLKSATGKN